MLLCGVLLSALYVMCFIIVSFGRCLFKCCLFSCYHVVVTTCVALIVFCVCCVSGSVIYDCVRSRYIVMRVCMCVVVSLSSRFCCSMRVSGCCSWLCVLIGVGALSTCVYSPYMDMCAVVVL